MRLNLIEDSWLPVRCADGSRRVIAPWQIAEPGILYPDWPRADLNIACCEFLIGLVYLCDPPSDIEDWDSRIVADPDRLKQKLAPYAPAFNLVGEGPLFLQDQEPLVGEGSPVDMLFIDSVGVQTIKNNADVMVHRHRYGQLDLPMAAMALYAFQAHAPSGGAGNRTSLRGGGPLVSLVDPQKQLWDLIWANVPDGRPSGIENLPWMRPTRTSEKGQQTLPPDGQLFGVEAFFGMPRRLRLVHNDDAVIKVIQRPWGTNYALWKHPLSPYYRINKDSEWLPKHPSAGRFGYRNWLGIVVAKSDKNPEESHVEKALCVRNWGQRQGGVSVIIAGWSMDNMKPRDFIFSRQRLMKFSPEAENRIFNFVQAAEIVAIALRSALEPILKSTESRDAEREEFYMNTEHLFLEHASAIEKGENPAKAWLADLKQQAQRQFEVLALNGLDQSDIEKSHKIINAYKFLNLAVTGYGKLGKEIFSKLGLSLPVAKKGKTA